MENAGHHKDWHHVEGMLLYPSIDHNLHHHPTLCSINPKQSWQSIESQL